MSQRGYSPFGWDFDVAVGEHFTEFLQYNLASDVCASGVGQSTKQMRKSKYRLLGHCKNYIPLDILKRGMLNEKILELKAMVRWLNEIPCKRDLVCSMVFELYLHIFGSLYLSGLLGDIWNPNNSLKIGHQFHCLFVQLYFSSKKSTKCFDFI